ncbi:Os02g0788700 [Oryza sativa Japonica Group]|uniref:Os02g0788700 protein n=1 Tax=Oryza sativa subsp. japonica TaxID=39947 RepID=A0A0N7KG83_ORYSJ|nr:Os02g0788700 [Oryza sativa Japonica Group]
MRRWCAYARLSAAASALESGGAAWWCWCSVDVGRRSSATAKQRSSARHRSGCGDARPATQASRSSGAGPDSSAAAACSGVVCACRRLDASAAARDSTAAASGVSGGAADGSDATAAAAAVAE